MAALAVHDFGGACYCGAVKYRYATAVSPASWPVRACQCSFCRLHAALTTSDPFGSLKFEAAEPVLVQRYRFGARTAEFLICSCCGVYVGAEIRAGIAPFGLINVRTLRPIPADLSSAVPADYDGESAAARVARRESRWTPLDSDSI
jgi:hypothetical protein